MIHDGQESQNWFQNEQPQIYDVWLVTYNMAEVRNMKVTIVKSWEKTCIIRALLHTFQLVAMEAIIETLPFKTTIAIER